MRKSILALAACLLLSGVAVAGCGGGDSTTSGGEVASKESADGNEGEAPPGDGGSGGGASPNKSQSGGDGEASNGGESSGGGESGDGGEAGGGGESPSAGGSSNDGGGEGDGATSAAKKEFVAKANRLCTRRRVQVQTKVRKVLEGPRGKGPQEVVLQLMVDKAVAPGMEAEADELRELQAPPGDGAKIAAIAAQIDSTVAEVRKDLTVLTRTTNVFAEAQKEARAYGIGACARAS